MSETTKALGNIELSATVVEFWAIFDHLIHKRSEVIEKWPIQSV